MNRPTGFRASYHRSSPVAGLAPRSLPVRRQGGSGKPNRATAAVATFLLVLLSGWSPRHAGASEPPEGEEETAGDQDDEQSEEQPDEGEPPAVEDLAERIGDLERRLADSEAAAAEKRPVVTVSG